MSSIATFLGKRALVIAGLGNEPPVSSAEVLALTTAGAQQDVILGFIETIRPLGVDVDRWLAWFDGGSSPVMAVSKAKSVERPIGERRAVTQMLDRKVKQTIAIEKKIAAARAAEAAAKLAVEELDEELVEARATNAAILEFAIFEHLMSIMSSNLAVGPLWAFMRAVVLTTRMGTVIIPRCQRASATCMAGLPRSAVSRRILFLRLSTLWLAIFVLSMLCAQLS